MKVLISIVVVIGAFVGVWQLWEYWDKVNREKLRTSEEANQFPPSRSYSGLPAQFEQPLQAAMSQGPEAFKQWLELNRRHIEDPRLAAIELDYVITITRSAPVEAKRVFADLKGRIPGGSPLYKKIKAMEKTYQ